MAEKDFQEKDNPVPLWLKLTYIIITVWCIWYLILKFKEHGMDIFKVIFTN